ncbi:MAG: hypothetical protein GF411_19315 [Candidatus Lokiarchaeota archaeon]|nr:hypothetical protein [Candidatus Lokiarchaeota archaeon]
MKLRELWRLAGTVSLEARFRGYLDSNPTYRTRIEEEPDKVMDSIRASNRINILFSVLIIGVLSILSITTIMEYIASNAYYALSISVGVYFSISFVLIFFIYLMFTTGFYLSGVTDFISTLPFSRKDIENLTFLGFIRVLIAPALLICSLYPLLMGLEFGLVTGLVTLICCILTSILSISVLLLVSKWYHVKTHSVSESKLSTAVRIMASFGLILGMVGVYSVNSYLPQIVTFFIGLTEGGSSLLVTLLSLVVPFTFGFLISTITFGTVGTPLLMTIAIAGSFIYGILTIHAFRAGMTALRMAVSGGLKTEASSIERKLVIHPQTPIRGIIQKDMRLANRNLGSIVMVVIPIMFLFTMLPALFAMIEDVMHSFVILLYTGQLVGFSGLSYIGLISIDEQGSSIIEGLPITIYDNIRAKASIYAIPYAIMAILLSFLSLLFDVTSPLIRFVPLLIAPYGLVVGLTVGAVLYRFRSREGGVGLGSTDFRLTAISVLTAGGISSIPLAGYALTLLATWNHLLAVLVEGLVVILMLVLYNRYSHRLVKA